MANFKDRVETMGSETMSTTDYKTNFRSWAYDSVGEFLAEIASENSTLHSGLMVGSGDAGYQDLVDTLPPGNQRRSGILNTGSVYIREDDNSKGVCSNTSYGNKADCEANSETWSTNAKHYIVKDGVFYVFTNLAQNNLAYHSIIKKTSLKWLNAVQTSDPNGKRGALITKMQTDYDHDKSVFASDANAAYTSNQLNDPIRLEDAYQKKKIV